MEIKFKSSKLHPRGYIDFYAKDLKDAYEKGYFCNNMTNTEFSERVNKLNEGRIGFRVRSHYVAMYDRLHPRKPFIAGLETGVLPMYNIYNEEGNKMLARGWYHLFKILEGRKYKVDWRGL